MERVSRGLRPGSPLRPHLEGRDVPFQPGHGAKLRFPASLESLPTRSCASARLSTMHVAGRWNDLEAVIIPSPRAEAQLCL